MPTSSEVISKFASTLIGPYDPISCSDVSDHLDFEGELAIVIGQRCRNASRGDALAAFAGLMVLNDITAHDLQHRGTQFLPGKAVDRSSPCGPAIVTLDEVGDLHTLDIVTRVNGSMMQKLNTKRLTSRSRISLPTPHNSLSSHPVTSVPPERPEESVRSASRPLT